MWGGGGVLWGALSVGVGVAQLWTQPVPLGSKKRGDVLQTDPGLSRRGGGFKKVEGGWRSVDTGVRLMAA